MKPKSFKEIPLTQNQFALVDPEYFNYLNQWKWYVICVKTLKYAVRNSKTVNGKRHRIRMHQVILGKKENMITDHINGNGLDNQRNNLRFATRTQNFINRKIHKNNTSGYKGVSWIKRDKKWYSNIRVNRKTINLGCFQNKKIAATTYNIAAKRYFGEFARLNII